MKRARLILFCALMLVPGSLASESVYLKDGSVLKGRLARAEQDTLFFETSFGSFLAIHRGQISRIEFDEGLAGLSGEPPAVGVPHPSELPGSLSVSFEKFTFTSRLVVPRSGDPPAYERENAIEQSLMVEGRNVYSYVDSVTDKTVTDGPETVLRNDIEPRDFEVALPAGLYRCVIGFRNSRASAFVERFDPDPLDKKLILDTVRIDPGRTTHVRIGSKRKSWIVGSRELFRID